MADKKRKSEPEFIRGTEHYVFVLEDGSLAAFGDNSYGQCDVQKLAAKAAKD